MASLDARMMPNEEEYEDDHCPRRELIAEAQRLTGITEKSALIRQALRALIERESARRLARLGGTEPTLTEPPRRRGDAS